MENKDKLQLVKDIIAYLANTFPNCFVNEDSDKTAVYKPLKIGVFNELCERLYTPENADKVPFTKTSMRHALRRYTTRWAYLESVVVGAKRVDLDGNEGDVITEEHALHAKESLDASKARFEEKQKTMKKHFAKKAPANKENNGEAQKRAPGKKNFAKKPFNKGQKRTFEAKQDFKKTEDVKVVFEAISSDEIVSGKKVHVQIANSVVPATVKDIAKDQVTVELQTGMVVKVTTDKVGK